MSNENVIILFYKVEKIKKTIDKYNDVLDINMNIK